MEMPLVRVICRKVEDDKGRLVGYEFVRIESKTTGPNPEPLKAELEECALTRAYMWALSERRMNFNDIGQLSFVTERGEELTNDKAVSAVNEFFNRYPQYYPLGASQHMSEVGKMLIAKGTPSAILTQLFGDEFAAAMDTNKWQKLCQIACQPGRLMGGVMGKRVIEPIGEYAVNVYVDEKHDDEDGMIWVDPAYWAEIIAAYTSAARKLHPSTTLIKVNSCDGHLAIKGVLQRASSKQWQKIVERTGRDDFQMLLCGNAIKYNNGFEVGQVYEMNQDRFAHHSDSAQHRGFYCNVSKQLFTRSGMDALHFIRKAATKPLARLGGLMGFIEEEVLGAIGAFSKDGEESTLDNAVAIKKRIVEQMLPANHPVNALQIFRLGMTVVRDHLAKISVPGFHGMGARSDAQRGIVNVPHSVYKNWVHEHGDNRAYLFRMPYLGSYCGRYVKLAPANTDTILVNWEDALQMEGDFDGDQYYVIPNHYVVGAGEGTKPARPAKGAKDTVPLTPAFLLAAIVDQAANKSGIGLRDTFLSVAFDAYAEARQRSDDEAAARWEQNIGLLQIYVQQAIEGLKHGASAVLSDADVRDMFKGGEGPHPYTQLLGNKAMRMNLHSSRLVKGYVDTVREIVSDQHSWHPLHGIFVEMAKLEFGEVHQLRGYYAAIKKQRMSTIEGSGLPTIDRSSIPAIYRELRKLLRMYTQGVEVWDGGRNRNVKFGEDVLEPIRVLWAALKERLAPGGPLAVRDLHLMLANVAYEPQPNWHLYSENQDQGLGLFVRIRRKLITKRLWHGRLADPIEPLPFPTQVWVGSGRSRRLIERTYLPSGSVIERGENKILVQWLEPVRAGRFTFHVKKLLPRNGSLFHHLADAQYAREILEPVLPAIKLTELGTKLVSYIKDTLAAPPLTGPSEGDEPVDHFTGIETMHGKPIIRSAPRRVVQAA